MAEYIDRQALLEKLCDGDASRMEDFYYNAIADFPAADVVEVVRCKDCKFAEPYMAANGEEMNACCINDFSGLEPDDFCSYGERRTDETDT